MSAYPDSYPVVSSGVFLLLVWLTATTAYLGPTGNLDQQFLWAL